MKKIVLILLSIIVVLISCDLHPNDPEHISNEEHAVISAVLDSIRYHYSATNVDVYDLSSTHINCTSINLALERDGIETDSLLNIYYLANRQAYSLNIEKLPNYVSLKDTEESDPYSGYLTFSRPGISDNGILAIVEYSCVSAPLAGAGYAVLLEKQTGIWKVIWRKMMWIS